MSELILELHNELITKEQEINRLKDIIREVREYIYLHSTNRNFFIDMGDKILNNGITFKGNIRELLEILDKVGEIDDSKRNV